LSSTAIINHVRCETRLAIQDKLISRLARIDQSGAQGRLSQARTSVWGSDVTGFLSGASLELFNRVAEAAIAYDFSLYTAEGATSLVASGGSNGRHILFPQTFRKILEDPELVCGEDNIVGKIGIDEVISSFLDVDSFTRGKLPAYAYTIEFATIVTGPLPLRALISTAGASQGIVPPPSADSRTDRHVLIVALSSDPQGDPADQGGTMPSVAKPPSTAQESDIPAGEREALDRINQSRLDAYLDRAWR